MSKRGDEREQVAALDIGAVSERGVGYRLQLIY